MNTWSSSSAFIQRYDVACSYHGHIGTSYDRYHYAMYDLCISFGGYDVCAKRMRVCCATYRYRTMMMPTIYTFFCKNIQNAVGHCTCSCGVVVCAIWVSVFTSQFVILDDYSAMTYHHGYHHRPTHRISFCKECV